MTSQEHGMHVDTVQFMVGTFYATETDGQANLPVVRLGKREGAASVHFKTEAGSAHPGEQYVGREGVLEFGPGEAEKEISIELLADDCWHATQEFSVELSEACGAMLSKHLKSVRVKILDVDVFPSSRYAKEIIGPGPQSNHELPQNFGTDPGQANHWLVMMEYFKFNFRNPVVRRGSIKCLIADQIKNAISIGEMLLGLYLVDEILVKYGNLVSTSDDVDESEYVIPLLVVALISLGFTLICHSLDYRRCFWKVGGGSLKLLQSNLLRRSLAYNPGSRALVPTSLLTQTTRIAVHDLTFNGYIQVFPVFKGVGNLIFLAVFQGVRLGVGGMIPIVVFPFFMLAFMKCRDAVTKRVMKARNRSEVELIDNVARTSDNVRVLTDFSKRGDAVTRFEKTIGANNSAIVQCMAVDVNNNYFTTWMGEVLIALFTFGGGYFTVTRQDNFLMKEATLGTFMATVKVFNSLRVGFAAVYASLLRMLESFPSLEQIVTLLNLETEDVARMKQVKMTIDVGKEKWHTAQLRQFSDGLKDYLKQRQITRAMDTIPLKVEGATFKYPSCANSMYFDAEFLQGELVGICSERPGVGKNTFLKLLAGVLLPLDGSVFVAPHLRLLHVSGEALFFKRRNLLQNICLGLPESEHEAAIVRVREILTRLGLSDDVLSRLQVDGSPAPWTDIFSSQKCQLLNLARALVADPEVIVAHTPLRGFAKSTRQKVLTVLREFVECRGFLGDPENFSLRHPRTCVFSLIPESEREIMMLDRTLVLEPDSSMVDRSNEDVAEYLGFTASRVKVSL